jgi:hypothetical protein
MTSYREGQVCLRCQQSWNGWQTVCNQCRTVDAINNQNSGSASSGTTYYSSNNSSDMGFFGFLLGLIRIAAGLVLMYYILRFAWWFYFG